MKIKQYKSGAIGLQMFASGDAVHGTSAYVNAGSPASSEDYVATAGSESGMSAEIKTFYDKALIELAKPALVHDQFGQKRPIPQGGGKSIEFRRFNSLGKALTAITEGVTPGGNKLTVVPVTATVDQYGDYVEMTDLFELTAIDNVVLEATKALADQAGRTMDTVVRNVMLGGTNVSYCPTLSGSTYTDVSSRSKLDGTALLRVKDVFKAAAQLRAQNAPTFEGSYVAIIHPYVAYDLMQEAGDKWIDIAKYTSPASVLTGEIGTLGGVRFVQSSEAKIYSAAGLTAAARNLTAASYTAATKKVVVDEAVTEGEATALAGRYVIIDGERSKIASAVSGAAGSAYIILESVPTEAPVDGDAVYPGEAGAGGVATFATLFIGRDAYGTTEINGGGIEQIVKQKGFGNDPLNQRSSVGWKGVKAAVRLAEPYMVRVESGSTFSSTGLAGN